MPGRSSSLLYSDFKGFKYRIVVIFYTFSAACITTMFKVSVTFAALAMLDERPLETLLKCNINTTWQQTLKVNSLNISRTDYSIYVGSYYIGNAITIPLGVSISDLLGPVWTIGGSTVLSSLMIAFTPCTIHLNFYTGVFNRFVSGICNGPIIPACEKLITDWASPRYSHKLSGTLVASYVSAILTWVSVGYIIAYRDWEDAFFIIGAIGFSWAMVWLLLISDKPELSFFISQKEVKYIHKLHMDILDKRDLQVPYKKIFKSKEVWAYLLFETGATWIDSQYSSFAPLYFNDTTIVSLTVLGIYLSLPPLFKIVCILLFRQIYKRLTKIGFEPIRVMKWFTIISHLIPSIVLLLVAFLDCRSHTKIFLITTNFACSGASYVITENFLRLLSPNFHLIIYNYGVIFTSSAFCVPALLYGIQYIYRMDPIYGWRTYFCLASFFYFFGGIMFILQASGKVQDWVESEDVEQQQFQQYEAFHVF